MKVISKSVIIAITLVFMFLADVPILLELLVPDAHAIYGVRRRTRRRTAVVVGTTATAAATATTAAAQQEAAAAKQEAAAAKKEAEAAKQQAASAPPTAATGQPLPLGTVVTALPGGCTATPVGGVQYYYCGGNFFRAVFQGNTLVYVTAKP
jgi:hypothetical protein